MTKNKFFLFTIILILLTSYISIKLISKKLAPGVIKYSTIEAERITTTIINESVNEIMTNEKNKNEIFSLTKNNQNEIQIIDFNTKEVNQLLKQISENIQTKILDLEKGEVDNLEISDSLKGKSFPKIKNGVVCEISSGSIFDNDLLANAGPLIPVKLTFVGKVETAIKTNIKTYGINSAYLEVNIIVTISERLILPAISKDIVIKKQAPLAMKVIEGKIPTYYNGYIEQSSQNYSLPIN